MDSSKLTSQVAHHYNKVENAGLKDRWKTSNFYQKNFNNWIKSVIIAKALRSIREGKEDNYKIEVLDMGSGKGGDLLKWQKGNISKIVLVDVADVSVNQSRERYEELKRREEHRQTFKHKRKDNFRAGFESKRYKFGYSNQQHRNMQQFPSSSFEQKHTENKYMSHNNDKNNVETSSNSARNDEYKNLNFVPKVDANFEDFKSNAKPNNNNNDDNYNNKNNNINNRNNNSQYDGGHNRNTQKSKLFSAEFIIADCTRAKLWKHFTNLYQMFDIVSSQFCFHYSFESLEQTRTWLSNASDSLKVGGYFIGTIVDSNTLLKCNGWCANAKIWKSIAKIWKRLRMSETMSFRNDIYKVEFLTENKDNIPLFNAKYNFYLKGSVDCPEFLVYFPLMKKLAEEHGLKLVYCKSFKEIFDENCLSNDFKPLLKRMCSLEDYPSKNQRKSAEQYKHADEVIKNGTASSVFTLSQEEWEISSLYRVFSFQKT